MRTEHPTRPAPAVATGAPLLKLANVEVAYGGIRALKGISLEVAKGEIVAMIGANGAGKTTTLKTIMRLLPLASGHLEFAGRTSMRSIPRPWSIAASCLVPEGRAIFSNLTVKENLELGAYNHKHARTIRESIEDVVKLFPRLGERMTQEGGTLSGGEQQMLAIGRALMGRPSLLLLDEPSLGIAPRLVQDIFAAIAQIAASGTTILLVEQNTRLALQYSARAYVLRTGEIAEIGLVETAGRRSRNQRSLLGRLIMLDKVRAKLHEVIATSHEAGEGPGGRRGPQVVRAPVESVLRRSHLLGSRARQASRRAAPSLLISARSNRCRRPRASAGHRLLRERPQPEAHRAHRRAPQVARHCVPRPRCHRRRGDARVHHARSQMRRRRSPHRVHRRVPLSAVTTKSSSGTSRAN